jgi:hypothetical protein
MFREVARKKQAIPREECIQILKDTKRGVLSVNGDGGYPYGMPINHYYNEDDGLIYFHSGKRGHRTDSFRADGRASYCVYDDGVSEDGSWVLHFRSVIVFGRIEEITDTERIYDISRKLCYKFTDDEEFIEHHIESYGPATLMFVLRPEHVTGKRVKEE